MRTAALFAGLLVLTACSSGTDPWQTDGWRNNMLDYETDFWEPIEEPRSASGTRAPQPAPRAAPQSTPAWTTPGPRAVPPAPRPVPRSTPGVPPPPPPPYELPR